VVLRAVASVAGCGMQARLILAPDLDGSGLGVEAAFQPTHEPRASREMVA